MSERLPRSTPPAGRRPAAPATPSFWGDDEVTVGMGGPPKRTEPTSDGPYGRPPQTGPLAAPRTAQDLLRARVAELAAQAIAESERRWERAGRAALDQLQRAIGADADAEHAARVVTARAILEAAAGDAPTA